MASNRATSSIPIREQAPAEARLRCIGITPLGRLEKVTSRLDDIAPSPIEWVQAPDEPGLLAQTLRESSFDFCIAEWAYTDSDAESAGQAAVRSQGAPMCITLPTLCVWSGPLTRSNLQQLRYQGISAVYSDSLKEDLVRALLGHLARASAWKRLTANVAELTTTESDHALVTVECPHWSDYRDCSYGELPAICGGDTCSGWYGRIYMASGRPVHAETPRATGLKALRQMMEVDSVSMRFHRVYIKPRIATLSGSLEDCVLQAKNVTEDEVPESVRYEAGVPSSNEQVGPSTANHWFLAESAEPPTTPKGKIEMNEQESLPTSSGMHRLDDGVSSSPHSSAKESRTASKSTRSKASKLTATQFRRFSRELSDLDAVALMDSTDPSQASSEGIELPDIQEDVLAAHEEVEDVAALLGLGELTGWAIQHRREGLYLGVASESYALALGRVRADPDVLLGRLREAAETARAKPRRASKKKQKSSG